MPDQDAIEDAIAKTEWQTALQDPVPVGGGGPGKSNQHHEHSHVQCDRIKQPEVGIACLNDYEASDESR